jgi:hypothetical protein
VSKFVAELKGYHVGSHRYFGWRLVQARKGGKVIAEGSQIFPRPGVCRTFVEGLFGCNDDIEIVERPGFRRKP